MNRRSDTALTVALSLSLISHAGLGVFALRERIAELAGALHHPPLTETELAHRDAPEPPEADAAPIISDPPAQTVQDLASAPPPTAPKQLPSPKPKPPVEENSEWGEKDGKGIAVTSTPGTRDLSARKGTEDQAFASRDPEGPQPRPDEPSPSTALPGHNGDGKPPSQAAPLEAHGTQGEAAAETLGMSSPTTPYVPPPPVLKPDRASFARDDRGFATPETSGPSRSRLPSPEAQSVAERNSPPADRDALVNDRAWGDAAQILPIKRIPVIALRSAGTPYPEIVAALTRPPGFSLSSEAIKTPDAPVLPADAVAAVTASPDVQPATASIALPQPKAEEMALRVGDIAPTDAPPIVEALTHPPDQRDTTGGTATLPELVSPDERSAPTIADAVVSDLPDEARPEELAQRVDQPSDTTSSAKPVTDSASASAAATNAQAGMPGPPMEAADPAPDTALESDPFAKIPGVEFHDGKVAARSGRRIKPVRPRLSDIAKRDLIGLQFPTILLRVRIDKTGKVTDVTVLRGSGSQAVDMPVYRALWEWWFEPPTDRKGNPTDDVQLVAIHWG
jgi:TonB family protein